MMNYYYEIETQRHEDYTPLGINIYEYRVFSLYSPGGNKIGEATTEENANLIVTLMNGDHSGK